MKTLARIVEAIPPDEMWGVGDSTLSMEVKGLTHRMGQLGESDLFALFSDSPPAERIPESQPVMVRKKMNLSNPLLVYRQLEKDSGRVARYIQEDMTEGVKFVAVTGTNGKSTVVDYCRQLAETIWPDTLPASLGTLGYGTGGCLKKLHNTTPFPLDLYRALAELGVGGSKIVFMEASSHGLREGRLEGLTFDHCALTNITRDHLDYHLTLENYIASKAQLLNMCRGRVILNGDCPRLAGLNAPGAFIYSLDRSSDGDLVVENMEQDEKGCRGNIRVGEKAEVPFELPAYGRHNVGNALCAAGLIHSLGASLEESISAFSSLRAPKGRLDPLWLDLPGMALIDYAHTPDALGHAISAIREHFPDGKIRVLFGCGGDRDKGKRPLMGAVASELADEVILTSDNPRGEEPEEIIRQIEKGMRGDSFRSVCDRREALKWALGTQKDKDVLLIAGKGHEDTQMVGENKIPFDEYEICREISQN